jgi:hypothetical protein
VPARAVCPPARAHGEGGGWRSGEAVICAWSPRDRLERLCYVCVQPFHNDARNGADGSHVEILTERLTHRYRKPSMIACRCPMIIRGPR